MAVVRKIFIADYQLLTTNLVKKMKFFQEWCNLLPYHPLKIVS